MESVRNENHIIARPETKIDLFRLDTPHELLRNLHLLRKWLLLEFEDLFPHFTKKLGTGSADVLCTAHPSAQFKPVRKSLFSGSFHYFNWQPKHQVSRTDKSKRITHLLLRGVPQQLKLPEQQTSHCALYQSISEYIDNL
jgi:hypothetical protein